MPIYLRQYHTSARASRSLHHAPPRIRRELICMIHYGGNHSRRQYSQIATSRTVQQTTASTSLQGLHYSACQLRGRNIPTRTNGKVGKDFFSSALAACFYNTLWSGKRYSQKEGTRKETGKVTHALCIVFVSERRNTNLLPTSA